MQLLTSCLVPFQSYRSLLFEFWTLRFRAPLWGLGYDVHLRLIRKNVVDFLLVLIELLGVTAVALREKYQLKIGDFAPTGSF